MTSEYHKVHKMFLLLSGMLIVWEYVGITVSPINSIPSADVKITIADPGTIPTVLFVLMLYFAFRFHVEWSQCSIERRVHNWAKADLVLSYIVAGIAVTIFAVQRLARVRLADALQPTPVLFLTLFCGVLAYSGWIVWLDRSKAPHFLKRAWTFMWFDFVIFFTMLGLFIAIDENGRLEILVTVLSGLAVLGAFTRLSILRLRNQRLEKALQERRARQQRAS